MMKRETRLSVIVKVAVLAIFTILAGLYKVRDVKNGVLLLLMALVMGLALFGRNLRELEKGTAPRFRLRSVEDYLWLAAVALGIVLIFLA